MSRSLEGFFRHIAACNTAVLPGGRLEFRLGHAPAGWVQPALLPVLLEHGMTHAGNTVTLADPARLEAIGEAMAQAGVYARTMNCSMCGPTWPSPPWPASTVARCRCLA